MESEANGNSIDFEFEPHTSAQAACVASLNGEFFVLGGYLQSRQVNSN